MTRALKRKKLVVYLNARSEYDVMLSYGGTNSYTTEELVELHGRLVDEGAHDGIVLCNCPIVRSLFERWHTEFMKEQPSG